MRLLAAGIVAAIVATTQAPQGPSRYRTLDDRFAPPKFDTADTWNVRAEYLRDHVLATAGLLPLPEKTPLRPTIFGEVRRADYTVSKVYFESLPGFFVTGNLYRPLGDGPFPAILSPHGHWAYGRLENTAINSGPGRAINLARQGFVVFTYDMVGYNDSQQVPHTFSGQREYLWGLSLSGLQLWDSIRALDFLETLSYVRRDAIGMTGESGGGTQTFLASAVDRRIAVSVPVNMISLHMQGGCICENPPGLRLETTNVEIASTIAPRPLLMISATGDWTAETMESSSRRCVVSTIWWMRPTACARCASPPSTTTTKKAARRCTGGWRVGCSTHPRMCLGSSVRSRRSPCRISSSSTIVRCRQMQSMRRV